MQSVITHLRSRSARSRRRRQSSASRRLLSDPRRIQPASRETGANARSISFAGSGPGSASTYPATSPAAVRRTGRVPGGIAWKTVAGASALGSGPCAVRISNHESCSAIVAAICSRSAGVNAMPARRSAASIASGETSPEGAAFSLWIRAIERVAIGAAIAGSPPAASAAASVAQALRTNSRREGGFLGALMGGDPRASESEARCASSGSPAIACRCYRSSGAGRFTAPSPRPCARCP